MILNKKEVESIGEKTLALSLNSTSDSKKQEA
jgi:hypothetical protein